MKKRQIRRLPVVDSNGKLVGILAMNDIVLHSDARSSTKVAATYDQVVTTFKAICEHSQAGKPRAATA
jgi:CBS domain-containing protein